jgi:hypothetical protein
VPAEEPAAMTGCPRPVPGNLSHITGLPADKTLSKEE